jgi:hypothetical protein
VKEDYVRIKKLFIEQKRDLGFQVLALDKIDIDDLYMRHIFIVKNQIEKYLQCGIDESFAALCSCFSAENFDNYQARIYHFFFMYEYEDEFCSWMQGVIRRKKIRNFLSD